jgi:TPP-dependent pyruvate/acetoin dehydrogenase alpha subunit
LREIEEDVRAVVERGQAFALDAPFPHPSEVTEDVYA